MRTGRRGAPGAHPSHCMSTYRNCAAMPALHTGALQLVTARTLSLALGLALQQGLTVAEVWVRTEDAPIGRHYEVLVVLKLSLGGFDLLKVLRNGIFILRTTRTFSVSLRRAARRVGETPAESVPPPQS